jgi:CheY-like chemotaxis protein
VVRDLLKHVLATEGMDVVAVANGEEHSSTISSKKRLKTTSP